MAFMEVEVADWTTQSGFCAEKHHCSSRLNHPFEDELLKSLNEIVSRPSHCKTYFWITLNQSLNHADHPRKLK